MPPSPDSHLRIARPSRNLARAERFWVHGLNLEVLFRLDADDDEEDHSPDGYRLVLSRRSWP